MIVNRWMVRLGVLVTLGLLAVWWFFVADLLISPHSPRAGIVYICIVVFSGSWHARALFRFHRMTQRLRAEERAGLAPVGATTFAANQRFRYLMRMIESFVVLAIGILAVIATYNPRIQFSPSYVRLILTYFLGSILLTGYLTIRDLWVINRVRTLADKTTDDAALTPVHNGKAD